MRLEEKNIYINEVLFGDKTTINNRTLIINKEELNMLIKDDIRLEEIKIELVSPGENCRIIRVADVIEPRVKVNSSSQVFPGIISPLATVGNGETICLKNVAVVETWQMPSEVKMTIDMSGPAAKMSTFSSTHNIVLIAQPKQGLSQSEYAYAIKQASLKTAKYLAEAAIGLPPDEVNIYDLGIQDGKLPRVAYICQLYSIQPMAETFIYSHNGRNMIPSLIHPNEFFDGTLVNNQYDGMNVSEITYTYQNHPIIKELYKRNNKDLYFAGVILKDSPYTLADKERSALITAKLAKEFLRADGIIITKEGGGHPQVDLDLTCQKCEELNIKSVMLLTEFLSTRGASEEMTLFNSETANAIVSCGMEEKIQIPALEKVVGDELQEIYKTNVQETKISLYSALDSFRNGGEISNWIIRGALSQYGENKLSTIEY